MSEVSDHLPILIEADEINGDYQNRTTGPRKFLFEQNWANMDECHEIVQRVWRNGVQPMTNITKCAGALRNWSREKFGNPKQKIQVARQKLGELQLSLHMEENYLERQLLANEIDEYLEQKEIYWQQ